MVTSPIDETGEGPDAASPVVINSPSGPDQPVDENPTGEAGDSADLSFTELVIEGTIPADDDALADDDVLAVQTRRSLPEGPHLFYVPSGKKMLATVTCLKGVVRMSPPGKKIYLGQTLEVTASQVKLSNGGSG